MERDYSNARMRGHSVRLSAHAPAAWVVRVNRASLRYSWGQDDGMSPILELVIADARLLQVNSLNSGGRLTSAELQESVP